MPKQLSNVLPPVYQPSFDISENFSSNIGDKKVGDSIQAIINWEIVEKTRNYTVLRIHYLFPVNKKRVY